MAIENGCPECTTQCYLENSGISQNIISQGIIPPVAKHLPVLPSHHKQALYELRHATEIRKAYGERHLVSFEEQLMPTGLEPSMESDAALARSLYARAEAQWEYMQPGNQEEFLTILNR